MPIEYQQNCIVLSGICTVEEAEGLHAWLLEHVGSQVDLAQCEHMHTAIVQLLLRAKPTVIAQPQEPFFRKWIVPLLCQPSG